MPPGVLHVARYAWRHPLIGEHSLLMSALGTEWFVWTLAVDRRVALRLWLLGLMSSTSICRGQVRVGQCVSSRRRWLHATVAPTAALSSRQPWIFEVFVTCLTLLVDPYRVGLLSHERHFRPMTVPFDALRSGCGIFFNPCHTLVRRWRVEASLIVNGNNALWRDNVPECTGRCDDGIVAYMNRRL